MTRRTACPSCALVTRLMGCCPSFGIRASDRAHIDAGEGHRPGVVGHREKEASARFKDPSQFSEMRAGSGTCSTVSQEMTLSNVPAGWAIARMPLTSPCRFHPGKQASRQIRCAPRRSRAPVSRRDRPPDRDVP
jgi:hypothetical protein